MGNNKIMRNLRYYWHSYFWRSFPQPMITKVAYLKDGFELEQSELTRFDRFLRWRFNRKHHIIKHRWHKWINPTPRDEAPEISRFECRHCHIYAYMATPTEATQERKEALDE